VADRSRLKGLVARLKRGGYLSADHPSIKNLAMTAGGGVKC